MINEFKVGKQIKLLRKERKMSGEKFAEQLGVSPQAVSKWENGICLPNTAILPEISKLLNCTIDDLLIPKELTILDALYTDGKSSIDVTVNLNKYIHNNELNLYINEQLLGAVIESNRLKLLTVKYQIMDEIFYCYALQNDMLSISNTNTNGRKADNAPFLLLDAYYGNADGYKSAMQKMEHYEYFKWDRIHVNHETFPSNAATDTTEYLTLIYLNENGIHTISCEENNTIYYDENRTSLYLTDTTKCILPNIERLEWGKGMECPWAGAMHAALKYMGEDYTYEQIMGMSGACYRICFVDVWDFSCTDALVSFDFSTRLYDAIGYTAVWADRLDKNERKAERLAIMKDLQAEKPVLAINLRVAAEWGVITGYIDSGSSFLCRTYFDKEIFDKWENSTDTAEIEDMKLTFNERGGYLLNDFWPFLIVHFGKRKDKMPEKEILITSLKTMIEVYNAENERGYSQGKKGYEAWIKGLSDDSAFDIVNDRENVNRRLEVNKSMLFNLLDARRSAEKYLRLGLELLENTNRQKLEQIADNFKSMTEQIDEFRKHTESYCDTTQTIDKNNQTSIVLANLRREQIEMLQNIMKLEQENVELAGEIIKSV